MDSTPKQNLVPLAIVAAGALIAAAIFFRGSAPTTPVEGSSPETITKLAGAIGVSKSKFEACWESNKYKTIVDEQTNQALALGGGGTPFPIIVTPKGETIILPGAVPFEILDPIIEALLANKTRQEIVTMLPEEYRADAIAALPSVLPPVTDNDHVNGTMEAPVKILEYSDLDCPFCKRFHDTLNQVKAKYGDNVAWIYRHWPILSNHPNAGKLAEATECVAELKGNEAFWAFLDKLFAR